MKNIRVFLSENSQFLEVKFSIYLNRRVFVMYNCIVVKFKCLNKLFLSRHHLCFTIGCIYDLCVARNDSWTRTSTQTNICVYHYGS